MADTDTIFQALVLTAPPPGLSAESSGAMVKLDGREVLLRCVELFLNRENVKQVHVVIPAEGEEETKRKIGGALGFLGVKLVVGPRKWQEQIAAAAGKISPETTHVIVHDGSRPLVPQSDVDAILEIATKHPVVALAAPLRCALVEVDEGGGAMALHSPAAYMQLLAPHVYASKRFAELAGGREIHPTEFSTLLKASPLNVRLSGAGDAALAKAMLNLMPKPKSKAPSNPFEEAQW